MSAISDSFLYCSLYYLFKGICLITSTQRALRFFFSQRISSSREIRTMINKIPAAFEEASQYQPTNESNPFFLSSFFESRAGQKIFAKKGINSARELLWKTFHQTRATKHDTDFLLLWVNNIHCLFWTSERTTHFIPLIERFTFSVTQFRKSITTTRLKYSVAAKLDFPLERCRFSTAAHPSPPLLIWHICVPSGK